ncbi:type II methionyl aminopeptidase [Candidatus Woesearchaeota archaeon]|nr:type II methionyl aminopeptidase [Candidatus Woesearchaeota archaeon]
MPHNIVTEEQLPHYRKAGKIAADALKHGASLIKVGAKVVDILDAVEDKIHELGGEIAFPAQISINEIAAHFCPEDGDEITIEDGMLAKLDCGAHIEGCVGDNAITVDVGGKHADLVRASREARDAAIKIVKPGITPHEIGEKVHEVITKYGFEPVRNLSGHGVGPYLIHTAPSIPNYPNNDHTPLPKNSVIAIEPFATTGKGMIYNASNPTLFAQVTKGRPRSQMARDVLKEVEKFNGLPFTTRWLTRKLGAGKAKFGIRELLKIGVLHEYPPLPEKAGGLVSQSEHTVLVKDPVEILTVLPED